ncbi:MAG: hypothetical protein K1X53_01940 [Candidatus Sumerlaeaceae bacterium]|nr:hypothetical protein [Candidatus Sumerlaeaceae bacterium]
MLPAIITQTANRIPRPIRLAVGLVSLWLLPFLALALFETLGPLGFFESVRELLAAEKNILVSLWDPAQWPDGIIILAILLTPGTILAVVGIRRQNVRIVAAAMLAASIPWHGWVGLLALFNE